MTKTFITKQLFIVMLFVAFSAATAFAQGTEFSFQGRLNDGTNPANGRYDLQFSLYNAIEGGTQVGTTITRPNTVLINGVFSVTLDFGSTVFVEPTAVFIEIGVKPNASPNAFTILGPRQQLTVVPFAIRASFATIASVAGNATNATNASNLGGFPSAAYPKLNLDNTGSFSITGDSSIGGNATIAGYASIRGNAFIGGVATTTLIGGNGSSTVIGGPGSDNSIIGTTNLLSGITTIAGNTVQPVWARGLPKAMLFVNAGNQIIRCFNAVTNNSTGNCGFSVMSPTGTLNGIYRINFGFSVDNTFVSAISQYSVSPGGNRNSGISYVYFNNTTIDFFTWDSLAPNDTHLNSFTVILF
jgi:hypothetical protein